MARVLRGPQSSLLGVILSEAGDPLLNAALDAVVDECRRVGWHVVLAHAQSDSHVDLDVIEASRMKCCEGLIIAGDLPDDTRLWAVLEEQPQVPTVGILQGQRGLSIPVINSDNRRGARLALDHLTRLGHRRIAFIGHSWAHGRTGRAQAYEEFMAERTLAPPPGYRDLVPDGPDCAREACWQLLSLPEPPTAILAETDRLALATISAASQAGRRVPAELSVVGFDDIPLAAISAPPLTTVRTPLADIVRLAVDDLVGRVTHRTGQPAHSRGEVTCLEPRLAVRASTAIAPDSR